MSLGGLVMLKGKDRPTMGKRKVWILRWMEVLIEVGLESPG